METGIKDYLKHFTSDELRRELKAVNGTIAIYEERLMTLQNIKNDIAIALEGRVSL